MWTLKQVILDYDGTVICTDPANCIHTNHYNFYLAETAEEIEEEPNFDL